MPPKSKLSNLKQQMALMEQELVLVKARAALADEWSHVPRGGSKGGGSVASSTVSVKDPRAIAALIEMCGVKPNPGTDIYLRVAGIGTLMSRLAGEGKIQFPIGDSQPLLQEHISALLVTKPGARVVCMVKKDRNGNEIAIPLYPGVFNGKQFLFGVKKFEPAPADSKKVFVSFAQRNVAAVPPQ